jgi:hypothetical protein
MSFCMTIQNSRANYLLTVKGTSHSPATKLLVERIVLYLKPTNNHRSKSSSSRCARSIVHTRWMVPPGLPVVSKIEISQFGIFAFRVPGSRLCRFEKMARKALSKS